VRSKSTTPRIDKRKKRGKQTTCGTRADKCKSTQDATKEEKKEKYISSMLGAKRKGEKK